MKIICKKEFIVKFGDYILLQINPGDCIEVSETNIEGKSETNIEGKLIMDRYFYTKNKVIFALDKDYFYSLDEWRNIQLNKIGL